MLYPGSLQGLVCLQMEGVRCLDLCQVRSRQWSQLVEHKVDWIGLDLKLKDYISSKYICRKESYFDSELMNTKFKLLLTLD